MLGGIFITTGILWPDKNAVPVPKANRAKIEGSGATVKLITATPPLFTVASPEGPSAMKPPTEIDWDVASKPTGD